MTPDVEALFADRQVPPEAWESAGPLIDHIVSHYHRPLVRMLPALRRRARRAAGASSGVPHPALATLTACLAELQMEMAVQMIKEDGWLFPAIRRLEQRRLHGAGRGRDNGAAEVEERIRFARAEHGRTLDLLVRIRRLLPACGDEDTPGAAAIMPLFHQTDRHIRGRIHLQDQVLFRMVGSAW